VFENETAWLGILVGFSRRRRHGLSFAVQI
jgi:hypothetical protein